ncbi:DUF1566 domain-containing protein, partial [Dysgonomonas sp. 521]|uniref:Lcl C-terminal domain-containing protein n=1 Tax=Dysgonomonas sp. 521 TaxID=2302932 RepID=UPI0013D6774C
DGLGTDVMLKLDISVQDCTCCPGYFAIGGEYTVLPSALDANGYLKTSSSLTFTQTSAKFEATGKDVCFYKTDARAIWNNAANACGNGYVGTVSYIDAEHRSMGWRLPTVAELGALQSIHAALSTQPTSALDTQNLHTANYWSSHELNATNVWAWDFFNQFSDGRYSKSNDFYVRCVRSY